MEYWISSRKLRSQNIGPPVGNLEVKSLDLQSKTKDSEYWTIGPQSKNKDSNRWTSSRKLRTRNKGSQSKNKDSNRWTSSRKLRSRIDSGQRPETGSEFDYKQTAGKGPELVGITGEYATNIITKFYTEDLRKPSKYPIYGEKQILAIPAL